MIYLDGNWVTENEAKISVMDIAILRGFGIFDFLRTYGKKPFRLDDHIDRFFNSAHLMGMTPVHSHEEITDLVREGIEKNGFENTNIKFIQTGGISKDGFTPSEKQSFFLYFYEAHDYPEQMYTKGITLKTSYLMRQLPKAKTINYAASIVEVQNARKEGASDILHSDEKGNIYEGTRSNFFAVRDGKLITTEEGILEGITRKVIIEIANKLGISIEYRFVKTPELSDIHEAFVSNSSQEIVPVVKINEATIGDGQIGPTTNQIIQEFRLMTES